MLEIKNWSRRYNHSFRLGNTRIDLNCFIDDFPKIVKELRQVEGNKSGKPSYPGLGSFDFLKEHHLIYEDYKPWIAMNHYEQGFHRDFRYTPLCGWDWLENAWNELQGNGHKYYEQGMTISYDGRELGKFDTSSKRGEIKKLVKGVKE